MARELVIHGTDGSSVVTYHTGRLFRLCYGFNRFGNMPKETSMIVTEHQAARYAVWQSAHLRKQVPSWIYEDLK